MWWYYQNLYNQRRRNGQKYRPMKFGIRRILLYFLTFPLSIALGCLTGQAEYGSTAKMLMLLLDVIVTCAVLAMTVPFKAPEKHKKRWREERNGFLLIAFTFVILNIFIFDFVSRLAWDFVTSRV